MDCIFCQIASGAIPATKTYEDEQVVVFDDIAPKAVHHKVIIPRKHIATLNDIEKGDEQLIGHFVRTAAEIAKQLGIAEEGYRFVINCNAGGGQTVFHVHAHLLGGRQMNWPPG